LEIRGDAASANSKRALRYIKSIEEECERIMANSPNEDVTGSIYTIARMLRVYWQCYHRTSVAALRQFKGKKYPDGWNADRDKLYIPICRDLRVRTEKILDIVL